MHHFFSQQVRRPNPTFKLFDSNFINGIANLKSDLTINGVTVSPTFRYEGKNATTELWTPTVGEQLGLTSTGDNPTVDLDTPFLNSTDRAVKYNGGTVHTADNNSFADISTEDFVLELVLEGQGNTAGGIISKLFGSQEGWWLNHAVGLMQLIMRKESSQVILQSAGTPAVFLHVIAFMDRSGFGQFYINGAASGAAVDISSISDCSNVQAPFIIGSNNNFSTKYQSRLIYTSLWKSNNWLDTHLQQAIAQERFNRLIGIQPSKAEGTIIPTVQTRTTLGYLDKQDPVTNVRSLFKVGAGWLRLCSRKESGDKLIHGLLSEALKQNACLQSEDFATTWTVFDPGDTISSDAIVAPNGETTADGVVPDAETNGLHGVIQASIATTAGTSVFSVWAKKGSVDWIYMNNSNDPAYSLFNISAGTIGTTSGGANLLDRRIEDWGNGWYRCSVIHTTTTRSSTFRVLSCADDSASNPSHFTGDGSTVSTYLWGAQVESSTDGAASSYYPTATGAITRSADRLRFKGDDGNLGGVGSNMKNTIMADFICPDFTSLQERYLVSLSDGGSNDERIFVSVGGADDRNRVFVRAEASTTVAIAGTQDNVDGKKHTAKALIETDNTSLFVDGVQVGNTDISCAIPDDLDEIEIGGLNNGAIKLDYGLVSNIKIFERLAR